MCLVSLQDTYESAKLISYHWQNPVVFRFENINLCEHQK